jgi:hypothetical protein
MYLKRHPSVATRMKRKDRNELSASSGFRQGREHIVLENGKEHLPSENRTTKEKTKERKGERETDRERENRPNTLRPRPLSVGATVEEAGGDLARGGADEDGDVDAQEAATISMHSTSGGTGLKQSMLTTAMKGGVFVLGKTSGRSKPFPSVPGIGVTPIPLPSFATAGWALQNSSGGGATSPSKSQSQSHLGSQFVNGDGGLVHGKSTSPSKSNGNYLSRSKSLGYRSTSTGAGAFNTGSTFISGSNSDAVSILSGNVRDGRWDDGNGHERGGGGGGSDKEIKFKGEVGEDGVREHDGDIHSNAGGGVEEAEEGETGEDEQKTKKRQARRLSHAALVLILERGRPITRTCLLPFWILIIRVLKFKFKMRTGRVLVTSSPLYQPMDAMERLGYEVRVYMRVPDLGKFFFSSIILSDIWCHFCGVGDGMDRERHHLQHHKRGDSGSGGGGSPKKPKTHARRISGSTSAESVSASASTSAGEAAKGTSWSHPRDGVARALFPFPESSSSSTMISPPASLQPHPPSHAHTHPTPASSHTHPHSFPGMVDHTTPPGGSSRRIRYREQGVDELLQLKLHQALAATDDVPEGATIVLATGDGNVGQFSEDGFLGS